MWVAWPTSCLLTWFSCRVPAPRARDMSWAMAESKKKSAATFHLRCCGRITPSALEGEHGGHGGPCSIHLGLQADYSVIPSFLYKSRCIGNHSWDIGVDLVAPGPKTVLCLSILIQEREEASLFFSYLNRSIPWKLPRLIVVKMCQVAPFHANHN